uniref:LIM zinc-binding domain-containing protein n=1 Tax=Anopheles epiroticus TaxID=199890 RepID=A0A182PMX3_9DIPT
MSALKLKPLEDSNLYKRRTTSKENLLQTAAGSSGGVGGSGASDMMLRPGRDTDKPSATNGSTQTRSPLYHNVVVPHPQHLQVENYYQQPKSPIRVSSTSGGVGGGFGGTTVPFPLLTSTPVAPSPGGQRNVQFLTPTANSKNVYDSSRPPVPFEQLTPYKGESINSTYQNLPTPTTPGRRMESWDQFGRSNVQTVAAGGVTTNNMSLGTMHCTRCDEGFEPHERIVNSNGQLWHTQCFVCAQCFRQFQDGIFYEFEGRKYCEKDFHILFAPCCNKCNNFVIGRVIKAMAANWHPQCFTCERCSIPLADSGFIRNQNRALCHDCNRKEKEVGLGKLVCNKCHGIIDDAPLRFRGEVYHGYHFNCTACGAELDSSAREVKNRSGYAANDMNELYCLRCHDRMGIPICGACRRPIEERVVTALGKHWHVEHFVCAKCEKPFLGHRHYEKRGMAYCETHYHQLFGNLCFVCNQVIAGDVFTALNKAWCVHHFSCSICDQKLDQKSKFFEYDEKPVCKKCYERFPNELRRRLRISHENTIKKPVP